MFKGLFINDQFCQKFRFVWISPHIRQKFHTSFLPLFLIRLSENLRHENISAFGNLRTFEDEDRIVFGWAIKDLPDLFTGRRGLFAEKKALLMMRIFRTEIGVKNG